MIFSMRSPVWAIPPCVCAFLSSGCLPYLVANAIVMTHVERQLKHEQAQQRVQSNLESMPFARFVQKVTAKPRHNAVAIATDSSKSAWGGHWGAESPKAARAGALEDCQRAAASQGVSAACLVFAVDGKASSE